MSSKEGAYTAPFAVVSPTDRGGAILIVNTIGIIVSLASVGVRIYVSRHGSNGGYAIHKDDLLCFIGLASCVIEFILVSVGVHYGNGKSIHLIPPSDLLHLQRILYAVEIFYIISLFWSRASIILLYQRIQGASPWRVWEISVLVLLLWTIVCVLITALKCNLSHPWIQFNVSCTGKLTRWQFIQISSIVLEFIMFGLGIYLVTMVRMKLSSKAQVLILFATRSIVVIFTAFSVAYLYGYFAPGDPTLRGITTSIYGLAAMYCSLITTTTPLLKTFIVKFSVIGAKPIAIFRIPQSTTIPKAEHGESDENWEENMSKWQNQRIDSVMRSDLAGGNIQHNKNIRGGLPESIGMSSNDHTDTSAVFMHGASNSSPSTTRANLANPRRYSNDSMITKR